MKLNKNVVKSELIEPSTSRLLCASTLVQVDIFEYLASQEASRAGSEK